MNNYLHKSLTIIALALLLTSCSKTTTVTQNTKPVLSAQSDIDKGIIAAKSKSYKKAIIFFTTSIDKNPKIAEAYYYRGKAWQKLGKVNKAQNDYFKALELNMEYPEVHNSLGVLYTYQGDYRDAIERYTISISYNNHYAKPYINRGAVYFREGSYQKALFDFTRALEIEPNSTLALKNRANVYSRIGAKNATCSDLKKLCSYGQCTTFNKLSNSGYCQN